MSQRFLPGRYRPLIFSLVDSHVNYLQTVDLWEIEFAGCEGARCLAQRPHQPSRPSAALPPQTLQAVVNGTLKAEVAIRTTIMV